MFEYVVMQYRVGHAQHDIQDFCNSFQGWDLKFVITDEHVLIFEREVAEAGAG
jgi:hypothetical protein